MPIHLPWMKSKDAEGKETSEIVLSDDARKKLLEGAASKDDVTSLSTKFDELKSSLDSINAHFKQTDEEKKRKEAEEARRKATETQAQTEEEINELFLTDPVAATKKLLQQAQTPANTAIMQVRADNLKRSIFEDEEKYPHYTGEIKAEIDKILSQEPLQNQNNPVTIEHAYFSTVGRHSKEIAEGKLKSRFASAESSRGGTGNTGGKAEDQIKPLDEDGKKAAKLLGYKEDEYAKMLHEEGIGAV